MRKFRIQLEQQTTQFWVYEIQADSQEEAIAAVESGTFDPVDYGVETDPGSDHVITVVEDITNNQ